MYFSAMFLRWIFIFILVCGSNFLFAQNFNDSIDSTRKVSVHTSALFFIKNNEYKGPFIRGFTGIGAILKPQVQFTIDPYTSLHIGYYFLKYSGLDSFTKAIPLLSFTYKWSDHFSLCLGAIDGNLNHQLDQAHYQIDQYYQQHVEYGFQFKINSNVLQSELWLDWQQFIERNDPFPEKFIIGLNTRYKLFERSTFKVFLLNEHIIGHIGGEIDSSNEAVETTLNSKIGLDLELQKWIWSADYFYFTLSETTANTNTKRQLPFQNGSALKIGLGYQSEKWSSHIYYWKANDYFSPMGEPLLLSVSDYNPAIYISDREIILHDFSFELINKSQYDISFFLNNYFDLKQNQLSMSIELRASIDLAYQINGVSLSSL